MSSEHEDYDVQATLRKMEDTGGPQFCSTIERFNPEGCEGCPNKGKITTPAQLTKEVKEATPEDNVIEEIDGEDTKTITIPAMPKPYFRGQNGGVYLRARTKMATQKKYVYTTTTFTSRADYMMWSLVKL